MEEKDNLTFDRMEEQARQSDKRFWIVVIAVLCFVIVGVIKLNGCRHETLTSGQLIVKIDSVHYWRDQYNREHAKTLVTRITDENQLLSTMKAEYDSLALLYRRQSMKLQEYIKASALIHGDVVAPLQPVHDTFHHWHTDTMNNGYSFDFKNKYIELSGQVDLDSVFIDYKAEVPITLSQTWHRKWLLGAKQYYIDGYSDNPNVHLSKLTDVKLKEKIPSRFGVGPAAGYDPLRNQIFFGIGVFWKVL